MKNSFPSLSGWAWLCFLCCVFAGAELCAADDSIRYLCSYRNSLTVRTRCQRGARRLSRPRDLVGPTLAKGTTLRGFYSTAQYADNNQSVLYGTISFGISLSAAPTAHYIAYNETPPAECPGTVEQPEASAGHLCVYEDGRLNVSAAHVVTTAGENTQAAFGALINAVPDLLIDSETHSAYVRGTWAVTAP